jgi:hypothetical protein
MMVFTAPSNAGEIGGRGRIATQEELDCWDQFNYNYQMIASTITPTYRQTTRPNRQNLNYVRDGTIIMAAAAYINKQNNTNHDRESNNSSVKSDADTPQHPPQSLRQRSGLWASRWAESEAMQCFRSQLCQFDQGTGQFMEQYRPTSQELIAMATRKSQRARQRQNNSRFVVTSLQLAQAKQALMQQVYTSIDNSWRDKKYGHAPREKPEHSIRIAIENFNSLCIPPGNTKVTSINNLCQDFIVGLLCGCKMQLDWGQVPQAR